MMRYARAAAKACTSKMRAPNSLAFESVKLRSMYFCPKRYGSLEILAGDIKPTDTYASACARADTSYKGLENKRRDNAPIGSTAQKVVLNHLLKDANVVAAVAHTKKVLEDMLMGRVDLSQYIITKGLSKTDAQYLEGGTRQLHTELKKRIAERAYRTGEVVPDTGDRVPFVVTAGAPGQKACDLSEDPIFFRTSGKPLNIKYYIEKQVMAATLRVFTCLWEPEKLPLIKSSTSKKLLTGFRAYEEIFKPTLTHMRSRHQHIAFNVGIARSAEHLAQCAHPDCRLRMIGNERSVVVCDRHDRDDAQALQVKRLQGCTELNNSAWDRCYTCAGDGGFDERTCSNVICDNFFHRQQTQDNVADIEDLLKRFELPEKTVIPVARKRTADGWQVDKVAAAGGEAAWRAQLDAKRKKPRSRKRVPKK